VQISLVAMVTPTAGYFVIPSILNKKGYRNKGLCPVSRQYLDSSCSKFGKLPKTANGWQVSWRHRNLGSTKPLQCEDRFGHCKTACALTTLRM
jgi:hypothetical protein